MGVTSELRAEIERVFVPWLVERGFVVERRQLPFVLAFRRVRGEWCELVELQWEKYGRVRFVVNFARAPAQGLECGGRHFEAAELCAGWVPGNGRLQPGRGGTSASWFRQDRGLLARVFGRGGPVPACEVVARLIELFPEVEAYWTDGNVGGHLRLFRAA